MSNTTIGSKPARASAVRMVGWLAVASMLAVALLGPTAGSAFGASVPGITSATDARLAGNPSCDNSPGSHPNSPEGLDDWYGNGQTWIEVKFEGSNLESGATVGGVTLLNYDGQSFDWESDFGIDAVFVKTGEGNGGVNTLYVYASTAASVESLGDTDLSKSGDTGLSHISFCYDAGEVEESDPPSAPPSEEPPSAPPSEEPPSAPPSEEPPSAPPSEEPPSVPPTGSEEPTSSEPAPSFTGGVNPATGAPSAATTLPPTDGIAGVAQPGSDTWRVLLVVMAALLASILVLTPSKSSVRR
jgi:hypothetical protein